MSRNAAASSQYPTCAQCRAMGVHVCATLARLEDALGHATLIAFLKARGGREFDIPKEGPRVASEEAVSAAEDWLRHEIGHGRWLVPMGPISAKAVLSWGILSRLRAGASVATIAADLNCHTRTVRKRKGEFTRAGLLPATSDIEKGLSR